MWKRICLAWFLLFSSLGLIFNLSQKWKDREREKRNNSFLILCSHPSPGMLEFYFFNLFWPHHYITWHLSSPTRGRTYIPCIGRWFLNCWTTRQVPPIQILNCFIAFIDHASGHFCLFNLVPFFQIASFFKYLVIPDYLLIFRWGMSCCACP